MVLIMEKGPVLIIDSIIFWLIPNFSLSLWKLSINLEEGLQHVSRMGQVRPDVL
jgi:hypothetical protein